MTETCPEHRGQLMNFYCENCGSVMCILCKVNSHSSHNVIPLSKKCKKLNKKLIRFQMDFSKRRKILKRHRNNLENFPAEKIKGEIHHQYCNVKKLFFEAYQRHIAEIDNTLNVEQQKCMDEERRLDDLESVNDRVTELLSNYSNSSSFIEQSKDLLLKQFEKCSENPEFSPIIPEYVPPEKHYMSLSEEFFTLAERLLGHWKKVGFKKQTGVRRCQSLVVIPTFTKPPK